MRSCCRYADAAKLRDTAGTNLMGWWVGRGENDSQGHLLRVSAGYSRFVGQAYLPKELAEVRVSAHRFRLHCIRPLRSIGMKPHPCCLAMGEIARKEGTVGCTADGVRKGCVLPRFCRLSPARIRTITFSESRGCPCQPHSPVRRDS